MELTRNDKGQVVRHYTLDDAEAADRERRQKYDATIRATLAPKKIGALAALALAALALVARLLPRARPVERL